MFNGIIETVGTINTIQSHHACLDFSISTTPMLPNLFIGESIAVNGVCLTVTDFSPHAFHVTAVPETLKVTNLSQLGVGSVVNVERALKANDRISGHYVQGHVDVMGEIINLHTEGGMALLATIQIPPHFSKYIVNKGYIAIDGMSITVIEASDNQFTVTFVPHTQNVTIVKHYLKGYKVNIEVDILSKYVEKLLGAQA